MKTVWLLAEKGSEEVSYVEHGEEGDETNWTLSGPFAYTSREVGEAAAKNPDFLPEGVVGDFTVVPVDPTDFIRAIYNAFPPSNTDVFTINGHVFPLSQKGARWIDEAMSAPIWTALFDGGVEWLDRVLEQVAGHLDASMETVKAIGHMNAEAEDAEQERRSHIRDVEAMVQKNVRFAIVPESTAKVIRQVGMQFQLTPSATFWIHTMGMSSLGLPELEFREVPAAWVTAAGSELNGWAAYALDQGISTGDVLDGGGPVPLKYKASESLDPFWKKKGVGCLRLEVQQVVFNDCHKPHGPDAVH